MRTQPNQLVLQKEDSVSSAYKVLHMALGMQRKLSNFKIPNQEYCLVSVLQLLTLLSAVPVIWIGGTSPIGSVEEFSSALGVTAQTDKGWHFYLYSPFMPGTFLSEVCIKKAPLGKPNNSSTANFHIMVPH